MCAAAQVQYPDALKTMEMDLGNIRTAAWYLSKTELGVRARPLAGRQRCRAPLQGPRTNRDREPLDRVPGDPGSCGSGSFCFAVHTIK